MNRYIFRAMTLEIGNGSTELWLGIESSEPLNLPDLIPADDMTPDELAIVRRWIVIDAAQSFDPVR